MSRLTQYFKRRNHHLDKALLVAWLMAALYGCCFSVLTVLRHLAFNTHAFDLGLMHHVTWNTHNGDWFQYTYMIGFNPNLTNYLGDHVRLILVPIALLYHLYDGAETLLVIHAFVIGSAFVPLFLLGRHWIKSDFVALLFAVPYLMHPALQAANLFDFHPLTLAASFLIWAFYFAEMDQYSGLVVATLLMLICKENVALTVVPFGAYWVLRKKYYLGLSLVLVGAAYFALCFFVILPTFNPGTGSNAFSRYSYLGDDWFAVLSRLIKDPLIVIRRFTEPLSLRYMSKLWFPFGLLNFLVPEIMFVAGSELGLSVLSSFPAQRTILYQYPALILAVSAVACIKGGARLCSWVKVKKWKFSQYFSLILALIVITASVVFQLSQYGMIRFLGREYRDSYRITDHDKLGEKFMMQIPSLESVSAQSDLTPHISQRPKIYVFPTIADANYVLLDARSTIFPVHHFPIEDLSPEQAYLEYTRRLLVNDGFHPIDSEDGWLLLKKGDHQPLTSVEVDAVIDYLAAYLD